MNILTWAFDIYSIYYKILYLLNNYTEIHITYILKYVQYRKAIFQTSYGNKLFNTYKFSRFSRACSQVSLL